MTGRYRPSVAKHYTPAEMQAAIDALRNSGHALPSRTKNFSEPDALAIIKALYAFGFRVVKVGEQ